MLTNPEPDRNIEDLSDDEIYAAIRYLEPAPESASAQNQNADPPTGGHHDDGVVICVCLYVAVLGCLAVVWLYLR